MMAGPYDILIIGLVVAGVFLMGPLAMAWSKHQTSQYLSHVQTERLSRRREIEEIETTKQIRLAMNRRSIADAEAEAAVAEGRRSFIQAKVRKAVEDGDAAVFSSLTALPRATNVEYEYEARR